MHLKYAYGGYGTKKEIVIWFYKENVIKFTYLVIAMLAIKLIYKTNTAKRMMGGHLLGWQNSFFSVHYCVI